MRGFVEENRFGLLCLGMIIASMVASALLLGPSSAVGSLGKQGEVAPQSVRGGVAIYDTDIPSAKQGFAYASFFINRKGKKVAASLLGFCGEFNSGWVKIRNRKFRMEKTWRNGYGMKFTGKFSRNGKAIEGIVKVWGPTKKKCNSGERRYRAKLL